MFKKVLHLLFLFMIFSVLTILSQSVLSVFFAGPVCAADHLTADQKPLTQECADKKTDQALDDKAPEDQFPDIEKFKNECALVSEEADKSIIALAPFVERAEKLLPGILKSMKEVETGPESELLKKRADLAQRALDLEKSIKDYMDYFKENTLKIENNYNKYTEIDTLFKSSFNRIIKDKNRKKALDFAESIRKIKKSADVLLKECTARADQIKARLEKVSLKEKAGLDQGSDLNTADLSIKEQNKILADIESEFLQNSFKGASLHQQAAQELGKAVKELFVKLESRKEYQLLMLEKEKGLAEKLEESYMAEKLKTRQENQKIQEKLENARTRLEQARVKSKNSDFDDLSQARMKKAAYELMAADREKILIDLKEKLLLTRLEYQEDKVKSLDLYKKAFEGAIGGEKLDKAARMLSDRIKELEKDNSAIEKHLEAHTAFISSVREGMSSISLMIKSHETGSSWDKALAVRELEKAEKTGGAVIEKAQKAIALEKEIQQVLKENRRELENLRSRGGVFILWGNTKENFVRFFAFLLGVFLCSLLLAWIMELLVVRVFTKTSFEFDDFMAKALFGPAVMAFLIMGGRLSFRFLYIAPGLSKNLASVFESLIILNATYLLIRIFDIISFFLERVVKKTATKLDDQLLPLARKALKTLVVFAGVTIMLENLGYKVTSLVTGLGIGGLAFALAAKDTLSNLFGSIMIFTDKPFVIGDWVVFNGFEGIIEDIGVRSTKIRTWADTMITVPNSTVANASIENVSRFRSRRISTTLRLRIDTSPEKITQAVEYIRAHLDSREDVLKGHYIFYTDIGQYSHDIMIYYFAVSTVWRKYLDVRQSVFLDILSYFKENDIHLAVPTEIRADFDIQNI